MIDKLPKDPVMLMSMVNMKLRDEYSTLEELCAAYGLEEEALKKTLSEAGFDWLPEVRQFR